MNAAVIVIEDGNKYITAYYTGEEIVRKMS